MFRIPFAVALLVLCLWMPQARAEGECTCADLGQMQLRLEEALAAISDFMAVVDAGQAATTAGKEPTPYSYDNYQALRASVVDSLTGVFNRSDQSSQDFGDSVTNKNCTPTVNGATACMSAAMTAHESYHVTACKQAVSMAEANGEITGPGNIFFNRWKTMAEYASEEVMAYSTEVSYLVNELVRLELSNACNPPQPAIASRSYTGDDEGVLL